jgi:hypothetical protein
MVSIEAGTSKLFSARRVAVTTTGSSVGSVVDYVNATGLAVAAAEASAIVAAATRMRANVGWAVGI